MKVVLISGKARSGKDTFANYVEAAFNNKGLKVCRLGFGDYIRYYVKRYFGWDGDDETKPRDLMCKIGTEIIREQIDKEFHVKRILDDIKVLSHFYDVAIISDVREPIEIEKPKKELDDCISIHLIRENFESTLTDEQKKHYTEVALDSFDKYDYTILNDATKEELEQKAIKLVEELTK